MNVQLASKLNQLSIFKAKAFEDGVKCRVINPKEIPEDFRGGSYAEIAMFAILGRINSFYKEIYGINFNIDFNPELDMNQCDIVLCGKTINLKSKYLLQNSDNIRYYPEDVILIYNYPGFKNFITLMEAVDEVHFVPDYLVIDINYLWEMYMGFSTLRESRNGIIFQNKSGDALNNFKLYTKDFDVKVVEKLKQEMYAYKEKMMNKTQPALKDQTNIQGLQQNGISSSVSTEDGYNVHEVAGLLKTSGFNVYALLKNGELTGKQIGFNKKWLIDRDSVEKYMQSLKIKDQPIVNPSFVSMAEASKILNKSTYIVKQLIKNGSLKSQKDGNKILISKESVIKHMTYSSKNRGIKSSKATKKDSSNIVEFKNSSNTPIVQSQKLDKWKDRLARKNVLREAFNMNNLTEENVIINITKKIFDGSQDLREIFSYMNEDIVEVIALVYPSLSTMLDYINYDADGNCILVNYTDRVTEFFNCEDAIYQIEKGEIEEIFFKGVLSLKQFGGSIYEFAKSVYPNVNKLSMEHLTAKDYSVGDIQSMVARILDKDNIDNDAFVTFLQTLYKTNKHVAEFKITSND